MIWYFCIQISAISIGSSNHCSIISLPSKATTSSNSVLANDLLIITVDFFPENSCEVQKREVQGQSCAFQCLRPWYGRPGGQLVWYGGKEGVCQLATRPGYLHSSFGSKVQPHPSLPAHQPLVHKREESEEKSLENEEKSPKKNFQTPQCLGSRFTHIDFSISLSTSHSEVHYSPVSCPLAHF